MQQQYDVVVVGSGFSGLAVGIKLKQLGIDNFVILERGHDVGGTWRDNHYPGAACDVPSHLYSYSFEPNPDWNYSFGRQKEILNYLRHCADKYDVRKHARFGVTVEGARFDGKTGTWELQTDAGPFHGRAYVNACGAFSKPTTPNIPGIDAFTGDLFHTAAWNHDVDLTGKRVAVIGTGASAIQVVPAIQPKVGKLTLFQRTAAWVMPKADKPYSPRRQAMYRKYPSLQRFSRRSIYWSLEARVPGFSGDMPGILKIGQSMALRYLKQEVKDPELRKKLTPPYRMGCKRILLSNDYYAALCQDNAEVVTDGIAEVRGNVIVTNDGSEHEVDAIVCATGFAVTDSLTPFPVKGLLGVDLDAHWDGAPEAYLGSSIGSFPNMFTMTGPNTGLGHTSMVYMIEAQTAYVVQGIQHLLQSGAHAMDVKQDVQDAFNAELQQRLDKTIWSTGGCASWYKTEKGTVAALWPGHTYEFRKRTAHFDPSCYRTLTVEDCTRANSGSAPKANAKVQPQSAPASA